MRHTESLWVPSNHDEGNTESFCVCISYLEGTQSLWKEPRIIVKVVPVTLKARHSLWVFTSHSKRHNGSLWMSHSCFDGTSSLQRHKNYEEAESHCWGTQSRRDSHTERCEHTVIVRVWKIIVKAHRVVVKVGKSKLWRSHIVITTAYKSFEGQKVILMDKQSFWRNIMSLWERIKSLWGSHST